MTVEAMKPRSTPRQHPSIPKRRRALVSGVAVAWCLAWGGSWYALSEHTYEGRQASASLAVWPANSQWDRADGAYQLILFAHPFCPCTRASLSELAESLTRLPKSTAIRIVFATAGLPQSEVQDSDLVSMARRLPGAEVRFDEQSAEAMHFGATLSGETLVFDPHGRLIFHGGLTPGRGHQGDTAAQRQMERLVNGQTGPVCRCSVFGCRLSRPSESVPSPSIAFEN